MAWALVQLESLCVTDQTEDWGELHKILVETEVDARDEDGSLVEIKAGNPSKKVYPKHMFQMIGIGAE